MSLYKPQAPFEILNVYTNIFTINTPIDTLVLHTGNEYVLPAFNEYTLNRFTLNEIPCRGVRSLFTPDMCPGTLSIEGTGCYLKNVANNYLNKTISAGKLAENDEIKTAHSTGLSYCTEDGEEYFTTDSQSYLILPANMIADEFFIVNTTSDVQTCTITVYCPDNISDIALYNLESLEYEDVTFTNVIQDFGTKNSYTFTRSVAGNTTGHLQVMITYTDLVHTFRFSNDANVSYGAYNVDTWISYYNINSDNMEFLILSKVPESITCVQDSNGVITSLNIECNQGEIKHGKITYGAPFSNLKESLNFTDCLNIEMPGSLTNFLKGFESTISPSNVNLTTYVIPAISDTKILPVSEISSDLISDTIEIKVAQNEYTCSSFVVKSDTDVKLTFEVSDLTDGTNIISNEYIDLRYVDCWYQAGFDNKSTHQLGHYYTPELLVKDPDLVKSNCEDWALYNISNECARNALKLNNDEYIDITSETLAANGQYQPTVIERPVYDSTYLKPLILHKNYNKQIWVTVQHLPNSVSSEIYIGTITIKSGLKILKTITLSIEVRPIILLPPNIEYSIYYRGRLAVNNIGTISSETKSRDQFIAEHINMFNHGITNPILPTHTIDTLPIALSLRTQCGFSNENLLYSGTINIKSSLTSLQSWKNLCTANGVSQLYIYGIDESDMTSWISKMIDINNMGVKIFCAQNPTYAFIVKNYLDLCIGNSIFTASQIAEFKLTGNKIYSYGNPQTAAEAPLTFRRNYGLNLWQMGYDGTAPYAYQHSFQDIYSDFDDEVYREHCFTYPTADGVIDTIQYEGFREGINDIRYLTTLNDAIMLAKEESIDTSEIELWLTNLKTADLTTQNLTTIRDQIAEYIIQLQNEYISVTTGIDGGSPSSIYDIIIDCGYPYISSIAFTIIDGGTA